MSVTILEGFERSFLFRLTRLLAMSAIFVLIAGILVGAVALTFYIRLTNPTVQAGEVIAAVKEKRSNDSENPRSSSQPAVLDANPTPLLKIPFSVQKYVSTPQNRELLTGWLSTLSQEEKENFLSELSATIAEAEKLGVDPVDAINSFRDIKLTRLAEHKEQESQRYLYILYFAAALGTSLILISQLSVVLVLLAVERNTRPVVNA